MRLASRLRRIRDIGRKESRGALLVIGVLVAPGVALGDPLPPLPKPAPKAHAPAAKPAGPSRGWHAPVAKPQTMDESGKPKLVLQGLNIPDRAELTAHSDRGGFSAEDLDRAAHVMREPSTGNEHPIDPRLIDFIYRVAVHFKSPEVRVLSGYRTPHAKSTSNHGKGRAMDCVFPGTSDEEVAKFAREQGFVGVGVYPTSGFLHLDVRERSFFWIDTSGPGKKSRLRGILADLANKSDAQASARGDKSVGPFQIASDVDAVVGSHAAIAQAKPATDDDEDVEQTAIQ